VAQRTEIRQSYGYKTNKNGLHSVKNSSKSIDLFVSELVADVTAIQRLKKSDLLPPLTLLSPAAS